MTGLKYVFPTSKFASHVWYIDYKRPDCGLADDCAYNLTSIGEAASWVRSLLEHERAAPAIGGDAARVFLAGFSEGAQLTAYMQIANLDYALGGVVVMDGYPLPPLCDMPGRAPAAAKANATYYGSDMRWMIWHGDDDPIFPVNLTMNAYTGVFDALGASSTLKVFHEEPGMTHTVIQPEFARMVQFIREGQDTADVLPAAVDGAKVPLTLLSPDSAEAGARCMDGSPGGYYLARNASSTAWVLELEGGGECASKKLCDARRGSALFSSKHFRPSVTMGFLNADSEDNPRLRTFNRVFLPYCSQDLWTGQRGADANNASFGYYFAREQLSNALRLHSSSGLGFSF